MVRGLRALRDSRPIATPIGWLGSATAVAFTLALVVGMSALVWFGYRATREWQRSTGQLVERRANEVLALLMAGLTRDMKGTQLSVLVPINHEALRPDPPHELRQAFARAFARFPYPESFFIWRADDDVTYFFNRADRPPRWQPGPVTDDPYPVVLARNPAATTPILEHARAEAASGRTFALVETRIGGVPYQAVVHLLYQSSAPRRLFGLVGFTVDMNWVRENYFGPIVRQVARIGGGADEMSLRIVNEHGTVVTSNGVDAGVGDVVERRFPLTFFDPDLLAAMPPPRPQVPYWIASVAPGRDGALDDVAEGAGRTFLFISLAAVATVVGLVATARAVRAAAALAAMQSDFVSTVTHELKTPLASIRLISDTLAKGRYSTPASITDYARLLSDESERLRALVDNLLTFARVNDAERAYAFEAIDLLDLVEDVLEHAQGRLDERQFEVVVDIPSDLPRINVDRVAVMQVLANLVDNVIKYSDTRARLLVSGRGNSDSVCLEVQDAGVGIPRDEIDRVFDRFFRGHGAKAGGSGLGLTIARRVIHDHRGTITIQSTVGQGTIVTIRLPAAVAT
jgi:signal transduction histidine kinase